MSEYQEKHEVVIH